MTQAKRETVTKGSLRVGDLLTSSYGCTMHRVQFYQVVRIEKSCVVLGKPREALESDQYGQEGYAVCLGKSETPGETQLAKFTANGLKKACKGFNGKLQVGSSHWDYLYKIEAGYREFTYGD